MQQRALDNPKIDMNWNTELDEVLGDEKNGVTGARVKNNKTGEHARAAGLRRVPGDRPHAEHGLPRRQVKTNEKGYIVWTTPARTYTSVEGVFAAGDVADDYYRQAITAAGTGCMAAPGRGAVSGAPRAHLNLLPVSASERGPGEVRSHEPRPLSPSYSEAASRPTTSSRIRLAHRRDRHVERLAPFAEDRLTRRSDAEKHPVRDFLFEYYSYRPAHLLRWSPGLTCSWRTPDRRMSWSEFIPADGGLVLPARRVPGPSRLVRPLGLEYLEGIAARPPLFGCFGLHEWAMVYRAAEVRHSPHAAAAVARQRSPRWSSAEELCCTHFDAFRFFTPAAVPRNRHAADARVDGPVRPARLHPRHDGPVPLRLQDRPVGDAAS